MAACDPSHGRGRRVRAHSAERMGNLCEHSASIMRRFTGGEWIDGRDAGKCERSSMRAVLPFMSDHTHE